MFRADDGGHIVDLGAKTETFFDTHSIQTAQDFLGDDMWNRLTGSAPPDQGAVFFSERVGSWYAISHSEGPGGTLNVYGCRAAAPCDD